MLTQSLTITGNLLGSQANDPLLRAVMISLFTWRRANADDVLPGTQRYGWWGDAYAEVVGDRIGSRLWLLARDAITPQTINRAREYAAEALQWMIDDGVLRGVDVVVERLDIHSLGMVINLTRSDGTPQTLRFSDLWQFLGE